jgi:hypothetical protein
MTAGFPVELTLRNNFSSVSVYDSEFDIKVGMTSITHSVGNDEGEIFVKSVLTKEQFHYLYLISLSSKKVSIEFNTPMFNESDMKSGEPIILKNCTFWIKTN